MFDEDKQKGINESQVACTGAGGGDRNAPASAGLVHRVVPVPQVAPTMSSKIDDTATERMHRICRANASMWNTVGR